MMKTIYDKYFDKQNKKFVKTSEDKKKVLFYEQHWHGVRFQLTCNIADPKCHVS